MTARSIAYIGAAIIFAALVAFFAASLLRGEQNVRRAAAPLGVFAAVESTSSAPSSIVLGSAPQPMGTKEYENSEFHFALYYPNDLSVSEDEVATTSIVILFQNEAQRQGFQIFVTPYGESKITEQRFLMDEPSGVMNDPQNITIEGVAATEFLSTNTAMGAAREIWFLRGGYLYEVTAPATLDQWLLQIMGTWRFL